MSCDDFSYAIVIPNALKKYLFHNYKASEISPNFSYSIRVFMLFKAGQMRYRFYG